MIAKVFLGNCQMLEDSTGLPASSPTAAEEDGDDEKVLVDADAALRHSVCRARTDDAKQRAWVALEPALVLPEYIIEYEYEWEPPPGSSVAPQSRAATMSSELAALAELSSGLKSDSGGADGAIRLTPQAEADLRPLARPLASFVSDCRTAMRRVGADDGAGEGAATASGEGGGEGAGSGAGAGAQRGAMQALDLPPLLSPRPKLEVIDEAAILGTAPGASFHSIQCVEPWLVA